MEVEFLGICSYCICIKFETQWAHLTTAVAGADCADENVLAVALFEGDGAAAVALKSYFLRLLSKERQTHPCLTRVPARRAAGTYLAILPGPHRIGALVWGYHGN